VQLSGSYPNIVQLLMKGRQMLLTLTWAMQIWTDSGLEFARACTHSFSFQYSSNESLKGYLEVNLHIMCGQTSVVLCSFNVSIFMAVHANAFETLVSCAKCMKDFQ
jgi:hypothetical protein